MATTPNPQQVCAMLQARTQNYVAGQQVTVTAVMQNSSVTTITFSDLTEALIWVATQAPALLL